MVWYNNIAFAETEDRAALGSDSSAVADFQEGGIHKTTGQSDLPAKPVCRLISICIRGGSLRLLKGIDSLFRIAVGACPVLIQYQERKDKKSTVQTVYDGFNEININQRLGFFQDGLSWFLSNTLLAFLIRLQRCFPDFTSAAEAAHSFAGSFDFSS